MAGPGPIPWIAIHQWARQNALTADEEDALQQWIWSMDYEMTKRD